MDPFGFIILRHVRTAQENLYWQECVRCIRKFYKSEKILIIDDNSPAQFEAPEYPNVETIHSELPGAGEVLGYYYGWKRREFAQFVVLHDSMFLQDRIPPVAHNVMFLWHFDTYMGGDRSTADSDTNIKYLKLLRNCESLETLYYNKRAWVGCFGVAAIVRLSYIDVIFQKYDFASAIVQVKCRHDREAMERVFALLAYEEEPSIRKRPSLLGNISKIPGNFKNNWDNYTTDKSAAAYRIYKIWCGR